MKLYSGVTYGNLKSVGQMMTEWIKVTDHLPKPFEIVWAYWRDREVLLACRVYEGEDYLYCEHSEGWYSLEDEKCKWANYWQYYRIDKPEKPTKEEPK